MSASRRESLVCPCGTWQLDYSPDDWPSVAAEVEEAVREHALECWRIRRRARRILRHISPRP